MTPDHAYLCVRDLDPATGGPVLPDGSTCIVQDAGWFTLTRGSITIAAWRANAVGSRGLFALFAPRAVLDAIADAEPLCMPAREAWERRTESSVRAALRRWRHWRIDGHVRDPVTGDARAVTDAVVRLVPEGAAIPDPTTTPLPWLLRADGTVTSVAGEAAVRVTALHRPALDRTLAGYALHERAEDEPVREGR